MWDERYAKPGFFYGTEPAAFLKDHQGALSAGGRALCVADGEGRNSVYLAEHGLDVVAVDASPVGVDKARALAKDRGVPVDFQVADIFAWDWPQAAFDFVVAIFIQFAAPAQREGLFAGMKQALKPGGVLLLHGYRPEQVGYGTGGPPQAENMYTEALLRDAFGDMEILELRGYDRHITEGKGHDGVSALIDLVARKR